MQRVNEHSMTLVRVQNTANQSGDKMNADPQHCQPCLKTDYQPMSAKKNTPGED